MGQIVGLNAKPKRANLNALSLVPTPANGEIILVSSDNSMDANGQGNFDCYIVGDGKTAAAALELKNDALLESHKPYTKAYTFDDGVSLTGLNYKTNDAVVGYKFNDITSNQAGNSRGCKIPVMTGDVVTFKGSPYTNSVLLTDKDGIVLIKQANDGTIKKGTQWNIEQDGYIYWNPNFQPFVVIDGDMKVDSLYNIDKRLETLEEDTHVDEFIEDVNSASHREINIDIPSLQVYKTTIYAGKWTDVNSTARKSIIVPTKKNFTYRLSVPAETTVYYCLVTDISNAMTNYSPVAFDPEYKDRVAVTSESTIDIAGKEGEYLWVREDTALNFSLTEIGNDYEYIWRSEIEDSLDSDSSTKVLSARQGKALNDKFSAKVEHVIDYSSAGKNWGTRLSDGTDYTLTINPDNPRLITYTKSKSMPGSLLTLFITGLKDGDVYHFHMEYTSTSTILSGGYIYKQNARNISTATNLNIEDSKLLGSGQYTMDFDFTYDVNNPYYGWWNQDNFSDGSTLTITALSITQTKDIHDIYEMAANGGATSVNVNDSAILDEARHIAAGNTNTALHLLHFTDIHGDAVAADKIMDYVNQYSKYIDDIIDTGDTVYDQYTDGVSFMTDSGLDVAFRAIGNHDTWKGVTTTDKATIYNYIFAPFVEKWAANGMIQPADATTNNVMYWYKDYADKKVRLIGLDCMYQDDSQLSWFLNLLSETLNSNSPAYGYTIVIASHVIPADAEQATFLHNADGELSSFCHYGLIKVQNSPAIYFDDAYINGVDSFIEQGGKFGIWLCGHTHRNVVFYTKEHPNILVLNAAAAGNRVWAIDSMSSGTENQYLANVVSIDTTNRLIKIIRVGRKHDQYLRAANVLTIDYANKKVITNY